MKKSFFLFLILFPFISIAQVQKPMHFNRYYPADFGNTSNLYSITNYTNYNTVAIGGTVFLDQNISNSSDLQDFEFHTEEDYNQNFNTAYPAWVYSTGDVDNLTSICEFNSHLLGVGTTGNDMFIIELDRQDNFTNQYIINGFHIKMNNYSYVEPHKVIATSDGGLLIVGLLQQKPSDIFGFYMKLDNAYNVQWCYQTNSPKSGQYDYDNLETVKEINNAYIIGGSANGDYVNQSSLLLKIDNLGNLLYDNIYYLGVSPNEYIFDFIYNSNTNTIIAGSNSGYTHNTYFSSIDFGSGIINSVVKTFFPYGSNIFGYSIVNDPNNSQSLIMTGYGNFGALGLNQLFSTSFNYNYNVLNWTYMYPTSNSNAGNYVLPFAKSTHPTISILFNGEMRLSAVKNPEWALSYAPNPAIPYYTVINPTTYHPLANSIVPTQSDGTYLCNYLPIGCSSWCVNHNDERITRAVNNLTTTSVVPILSSQSFTRTNTRFAIYNCDPTGSLKPNTNVINEQLLTNGKDNIILRQTSDKLEIQYIEGAKTLIIRNSVGQTVYTSSTKNNGFKNVIDISDWPTGVYIVTYGNETTKFFK